MLGHRLRGNSRGPVSYPTIYTDLSSTRRSMWVDSEPCDLRGSFIYPTNFAGPSSIRQSTQTCNLPGDLCGPLIHLAIYAGLSSIRRFIWTGAIYVNKVCTQQSLWGHTSLPAPMPICAPAQCPSTNHGCVPAGMHPPYFATQCSRPHANLHRSPGNW